MNCKGIVKNNRGSTLIEASIILPMVILSIIGTVVIIIFVVNMAFSGVNIDEFLLMKTGEKSKTSQEMRYGREYNYKSKYKNITKVFEVEKESVFNGGVLLSNILKGRVNQRRYKIREKNYILYRDLFNGHFKE